MNTPTAISEPVMVNSYMLDHGGWPASIPRVTTPTACNARPTSMVARPMPSARAPGRRAGEVAAREAGDGTARESGDGAERASGDGTGSPSAPDDAADAPTDVATIAPWRSASRSLSRCSATRD